MPFFAFTSLASSSILAPVSSQVAAEFAITNDAVVALTISIFVLAQGMLDLLANLLAEVDVIPSSLRPIGFESDV